MEGFLFKLGGLRLNSWQKRFITFAEGSRHLRYHKGVRETKVLRGEGRVMNASPHKANECRFQITLKLASGKCRTMDFLADSAELRNTWIAVMTPGEPLQEVSNLIAEDMDDEKYRERGNSLSGVQRKVTIAVDGSGGSSDQANFDPYDELSLSAERFAFAQMVAKRDGKLLLLQFGSNT
jgi:hypothetical protein